MVYPRTLCCVIMMFAVLWGSPRVLATSDQEERESDDVLQVTDKDGPSYCVASFEITYPLSAVAPPGAEGAEFLLDLEINLLRVADGFIAPRAGYPGSTMLVRDLIATGPVTLYNSALQVVLKAIADSLSQRADALVIVAPDPRDIELAEGRDLRPEGQTALRIGGPTYSISRFELEYALPDHPELPDLEDVFAGAEVALAATDQGFVVWRPDDAQTLHPLVDLPGGQPRAFSAGAVQAVLEAVLRYFTDRQFMGVRVLPATGEIDNVLRDLRGDRTELRLVVGIGRVGEVRTLARGDRFRSEDDKEDLEAHAWIRERSPFQPTDPDAGDTAPRDLLKKEQLDNFLFRLSRHPGRRVDASIAPSDQSGKVALDYLVTENKPWSVYGQISNTGTEATDEWRYRFGLLHSQVTGNDDLLNIEYITAGFDESRAFFGTYEAPLFGRLDDWRWRAYGTWADYTASDVGFPDERFTGEQWGVGGELIWNVYQDRQLFVDLVGGARYSNIEVDNTIIDVQGAEDFFIPYFGARVRRYTAKSRTDLAVTLEFNIKDVTNVQQREVDRLGRLFADDEWAVLRWDTSQSVFLEPLLNRAAWSDPTTPRSSTLAHELFVRLRGQYAFDNRLIPQEQQVVGGFFSVRGYPESVVAGDTIVIANLEYRFHVPRVFPYSPNPSQMFGRDFRWAPQYVYGPADWDLILRGFLDVGWATNSNRFSFEENETLVGAGVGVEFQYRSNLSVRVDWGFALEDVPGRVSSGSSQVHFMATLVF